MEPPAKTYRISIKNTGQSIGCAADETVLHAALLAGIDYPYACASGNCGSCISHLDEGTVMLLPHGDAALSAAQVQAGQTLACRARPTGDVAITWLGRGRQ